MGKIIDFYSGKEKKLQVTQEIEDTRSGISFEFEETDEETLHIDEAKLKEELAKIKARSPQAGIAIIMNEPFGEPDPFGPIALEELGEPDRINPQSIQELMEAAQRIKDESDMIEFTDDDD